MNEMIWASTKCIQFSLTKYVDGTDAISCLEDSRNMICSQCQSRIDAKKPHPTKSLAIIHRNIVGVTLVLLSSSIAEVVSSVNL